MIQYDNKHLCEFCADGGKFMSFVCTALKAKRNMKSTLGLFENYAQ